MQLPRSDPATESPLPPLVVACGALVREIRAVFAELAVAPTVAYLPAPLHNRPDRIVAAIEAELSSRAGSFGSVILGYADCGTGGGLDRFVARWNTEHTEPMARLDGAHCYEFFAGAETFARLHEKELGTFFLTDFMVVNFDALIWKGLGLETHPQLRDLYFGNYTRALYLAQEPTPQRIRSAEDAATQLGLRFEMETTGLKPIRRNLLDLLPA